MTGSSSQLLQIHFKWHQERDIKPNLTKSTYSSRYFKLHWICLWMLSPLSSWHLLVFGHLTGAAQGCQGREPTARWPAWNSVDVKLPSLHLPVESTWICKAASLTADKSTAEENLRAGQGAATETWKELNVSWKTKWTVVKHSTSMASICRQRQRWLGPNG